MPLCKQGQSAVPGREVDEALEEMQVFLASINPALSEYAPGFVRDLLTPNLLQHLPWAEYKAYGLPNGHIALLQGHMSKFAAALHQKRGQL